ncbi:hypothetical protein [Caloranaerobacter azorensis]|uniref:Uncharacterized protein n=1 Tax=Caloranaerobacter azorensis TaxID=116090 RepID=A0A6P1YIU5_9FIRM|nr:hypothetical protein [Caloranaerobacter azorensis]QIB27716.1 hypothetical protein G3A45_10700 [Caloranaerobacter azorensis]
MKTSKNIILTISVSLIAIIFIIMLLLVKNNIFDDVQNNNGKDYIIIKSNGETLSFNRKDVNELDKYLEGSFDSADEINRIRFTYLKKINDTQYYLIHYGGGVKLQNNLLVKKDCSDKVTSKLISEASFYQNFKISPNKQYIAFLFGRNEGTVVLRNNLVIVDSTTLEEIKIDKLIKPFKYAILEYIWINNKDLEVIIPDIESWDFNTLEEWFRSSQRQTRKIKLKIY